MVQLVQYVGSLGTVIQLQSFNSMLGSLGTDKVDESLSMGCVCVSVCSIQTPGLLFPHRVTVLATLIGSRSYTCTLCLLFLFI